MKIESTKPELSLAVDRQKLIHAGKVLKDDQTVSSLGISETDFIVCMVSKEVAKVITATILHTPFLFSVNLPVKLSYLQLIFNTIISPVA